MADSVDIATERDYMGSIIDASLNDARTNLVSSHTGYCRYCEEPIRVGIFCNPKVSDCRDQWEHEQRLMRINGK